MAAAGLSSLPTPPSGGPAPRRMPPAHWAGAARLTNGVGASGPPSLYAGAQRRGRLRREVGSRGSCPAISSVSSSLAARSRDASVPDLGGVQPRGREALPRRPHEGESLAGAGVSCACGAALAQAGSSVCPRSHCAFCVLPSPPV